MSSNTDINENYHVVVRRGAVGRRPFIWEIQHKETARVLRNSTEPFATMDEAHRSGLSALARLSGSTTAGEP
jgi:hypothetical protein